MCLAALCLPLHAGDYDNTESDLVAVNPMTSALN